MKGPHFSNVVYKNWLKTTLWNHYNFIAKSCQKKAIVMGNIGSTTMWVREGPVGLGLMAYMYDIQNRKISR